MDTDVRSDSSDSEAGDAWCANDASIAREESETLGWSGRTGGS